MRRIKLVLLVCLGLLLFVGISAQARVFRNTAVWQYWSKDSLVVGGMSDSTMLFYNTADTTQSFPLFHYGAFVNKQAIAITIDIQDTDGTDSANITPTFEVSEDNTNWMSLDTTVYPIVEHATGSGAQTIYSIRNATLTNVPSCKWCRLILTSASVNTESCWVWLEVTEHFLKTQE